MFINNTEFVRCPCQHILGWLAGAELGIIIHVTTMMVFVTRLSIWRPLGPGVRFPSRVPTGSFHRDPNKVMAKSLGHIRPIIFNDGNRCVAQLVEQQSPKLKVGGSSPSVPATFLYAIAHKMILYAVGYSRVYLTFFNYHGILNTFIKE